jgi:hypothetical protein
MLRKGVILCNVMTPGNIQLQKVPRGGGLPFLIMDTAINYGI